MTKSRHSPIILPKAPTNLPKEIQDWMSQVVKQIAQFMSQTQIDENSQTHPIRYRTATKPDASERNEGSIIYVKDEAAGSQFQGSDGTAWRTLG